MLAMLSGARLAALAVAATVLLGLLGTVWWLKRENAGLHRANATLTMQLDEAEQINRQNVAALELQRTEHARAMAAVQAQQQAAGARQARVRTIQTEVTRAPATDDAPVAPVLERAIRMLGRPAAAADPDPNRADRPTGGAADVRPVAPGAR